MSRPTTGPVALVTGATGTQGGAVARHLMSAGTPVRALTRDPSSSPARALAENGADVVAADQRDPRSLRRALAGVEVVFSVQDFYAPAVGLEGEVEQGRNLAEAAHAAGVRLFVQSTMAAVQAEPDVPHFRSKRLIEIVVDDLGLPRTFLGTVWLTDNVTHRRTGGSLTLPALAGSLDPDEPFHILASDDLGRAAARVMREPDHHVGLRHDLASEVTSLRGMRADYHAVTGRRARRWRVPHVMLRRLAPEYAAQLRWQHDHGWTHTTATLEQLIETPTTFAAYLRTHSVRL